MNVILILVDSWRQDHVGCYGNPWIETPAVDALARESVRFTRVYPESLPTIPIRRAMHTGRRTFPFRNWFPHPGDTVRAYGWAPIPLDQPTLAEALQANGYRTALITDTYHQFKPSMNFHRGFDQFVFIRGQERDRYRSLVAGARRFRVEDFLTDTMIQGASASPSGAGPKSLLEQYLANVAERQSEDDYFAPLVFRAASQWLEENYQSEKFFLVVDSFDPHEPWDPPPWYTERYDPGYTGREIITPRYGDVSYLSEAELRHMRALYAGEVTMTDAALGQFLDHARRLGVLDRSLVVFLADHGHSLGEHGVTGKLPYSMYPELLDIPFLIRHPKGTGAGRVVDALLYNHDVVPTILDATGVAFPTEVDGQSLLPWVTEGRGPAREHLSVGFHNFIWVTDGEWALLVRSDGEMPRLYHLPDDPQMRHDLADGESARVRRLFDRARDDAAGDFPYYGEWGSIRAAADWYRSP